MTEEKLAELKEDNNARKFAMAMSEKVEKQLREENTELKEMNKSYGELIESGSIALVKEKLKNYKQLTKAKNILSDFLNACEDYEISEVRAEAEQFLKELDK